MNVRFSIHFSVGEIYIYVRSPNDMFSEDKWQKSGFL